MNEKTTSLPRSAVSNWLPGRSRYASFSTSCVNFRLSARSLGSASAVSWARSEAACAATGMPPISWKLIVNRATQATVAAPRPLHAIRRWPTATTVRRIIAQVMPTISRTTSRITPAATPIEAALPIESARKLKPSSKSVQSSTGSNRRASTQKKPMSTSLTTVSTPSTTPRPAASQRRHLSGVTSSTAPAIRPSTGIRASAVYQWLPGGSRVIWSGRISARKTRTAAKPVVTWRMTRRYGLRGWLTFT